MTTEFDHIFQRQIPTYRQRTQAQVLCRLYRLSHVRVKDIARQERVALSTVYRVIRASGMRERQQKRRASFTGPERQALRQRYTRDAWTIQRLAAAVHAAPSTVRRALVAAGVTLRPVGRPRTERTTACR